MNVTVIGGTMSHKEQQAYIDYLKHEHPDKIFTDVNFKIDGEFIDIDYKYELVPFDRIRRITGYLVGTLDRFNDAKRAEESQRVKHGLQERE